MTLDDLHTWHRIDQAAGDLRAIADDLKKKLLDAVPEKYHHYVVDVCTPGRRGDVDRYCFSVGLTEEDLQKIRPILDRYAQKSEEDEQWLELSGGGQEPIVVVKTPDGQLAAITNVAAFGADKVLEFLREDFDIS